METEIICSETKLIAVADEWRLLQARVARFPFADPASFIAWWQIRGRQEGHKLHVATLRQNGGLVALAPLVVTRRWGMRLLEWGGSEIFDYCDTLLDAEIWGKPLWDAIRQGRLYDFGLLRNVHPLASCNGDLGTFARQARHRRAFRIHFEWSSSSVWMADTLSASTRAYYRRARRQLSQNGPLRFEVCRNKPLPSRVLNALIRQKTEWLMAHEKQSWLADEPTGGPSLLNQIADAAAAAGNLHLCWLQCGDEIIATHLGFEHQGCLHWYIPTYAMSWARFAPGRLLLLKLIEWAIDNGLSGFDFMRGDEPYKARLSNDYRDLTDFIFANSRVARLAEPWFMAWYLPRQAEAADASPEPALLHPENP